MADRREIERAVDEVEGSVAYAGLVRPETIRGQRGGFRPDQERHVGELRKAVWYACTFLYGIHAEEVAYLYNRKAWSIRAGSLEVARSREWAERVRQGIFLWCAGAWRNKGRFGKMREVTPLRKRRR